MAIGSNNTDASGIPGEHERRVISNRRSGLDRRKVRMKFAGLDIDKGLSRYNGDKETYFQILNSYMVHTKPLLDSISEVSEDMLEEYAAVIRRIKASCRTVFADMICDAADSLEKAAMEGDYQYVKAHNRTFTDASWKLIFDLEDMLLNVETGTPKPVRDFPDSGTLAELSNGCRTYNMDAVDAAMAEMEKYSYTADDGLTDWLVDNIKLMNFKQIVDRLSALTREPGLKPEGAT